MTATTVKFDRIIPSEDVQCEISSTGEAMRDLLRRTPTNPYFGPIYRNVSIERSFDTGIAVSLYFPQKIYPTDFKSILDCVEISRNPTECKKCQYIALTKFSPK